MPQELHYNYDYDDDDRDLTLIASESIPRGIGKLRPRLRRVSNFASNKMQPSRRLIELLRCVLSCADGHMHGNNFEILQDCFAGKRPPINQPLGVVLALNAKCTCVCNRCQM